MTFLWQNQAVTTSRIFRAQHFFPASQRFEVRASCYSLVSSSIRSPNSAPAPLPLHSAFLAGESIFWRSHCFFKPSLLNPRSCRARFIPFYFPTKSVSIGGQLQLEAWYAMDFFEPPDRMVVRVRGCLPPGPTASPFWREAQTLFLGVALLVGRRTGDFWGLSFKLW